MEKKLVIMPNWIGDTVLALSVIIRKAETENVDLTLLAPRPIVDLCSKLCEFRVILYNRRSHQEFVETIRGLRSAKFMKAYILPLSFSSAWCAFRAGIPKRRGISKECRSALLTQALPGRLRNVNDHLTHEYAEVLETPVSAPETWQINIKAAPGADSPYKNAIVFCPGSKYGPAKKWPWFGELARQLSQDNIVLLGDGDEVQSGSAIEVIDPKRIANLIGKTSLSDVVSIIATARLVVSNDSGLMHLAGFLGTPVIGIFGSTSAVWTRPLGKRVKIATSQCDCAPCFSRTCRFSHYNCLKTISPEKVKSLADQLLRG
jgi:heptosyltransferase II